MAQRGVSQNGSTFHGSELDIDNVMSFGVASSIPPFNPGIVLPKFTLRSSASSNSTKRIEKELEEMTTNPPEYCTAAPKGDNLYEWVGTIEGPPGTVYENGIFFIEILFNYEYPFKPPKVMFKTRIYHCNINSQGLIALDLLKDNWRPACTISEILQAIYGLLITCDPKNPLVASIAKQYLQNRDEHDRIAREWTRRYAA